LKRENCYNIALNTRKPYRPTSVQTKNETEKLESKAEGRTRVASFRRAVLTFIFEKPRRIKTNTEQKTVGRRQKKKFKAFETEA
jgi:hypothetical protein